MKIILLLVITLYAALAHSRCDRYHQSEAGGVIYTRWGQKKCPSTGRTELVYEGIVAGTNYLNTGGGGNYLCMPSEPEYLTNKRPKYSAHDFALSYLYGTEYQLPGFDFYDYNVPCAVCRTSSRSTKVQVPAKTTCPDKTWTEEYKGYLVAERSNQGHHQNVKVFECMDQNYVGIPGSAGNTNGALFQMVAVKCYAGGIPCPDYQDSRPITCIVCTK